MLRFLLGDVPTSGALRLNGTDITAAVRDAMLLGLIVAIEDFDQKDFGLYDGLITSACVLVITLLRRYIKDYHPKPGDDQPKA